MFEIKTININDENYPKSLKEIKNPPKTLYYKGEILPKEDCLAIVGTRKYSFYGKQIALEIASNLAEAGLTIVSGLAPGIDTFAHTATVEKGKRTIAVLGTGVDEKSIYPKENIRLSEKIIESGGLIISEYPPGTKGAKFTFPQRNRIISGLSLGTLVIEAKEKSGSLITANDAFKQKRKVFAVPGSIYSLNSKGTNLLIKQGAKLTTNANDILKELNLKKETMQKNIITGESKEENLILATLNKNSSHIDKIIRETGLPAAKIAGLLAILEIKGKVINLGGNIYALKH